MGEGLSHGGVRIGALQSSRRSPPRPGGGWKRCPRVTLWFVVALTACGPGPSETPMISIVAECLVHGEDSAGCDSPCARCHATCGDAVLDPGEQCDDGNAIDGDGCSVACTTSTTAYLKASNTQTNDNFGTAVALSADGSTLAVGAPGEDSAATTIDGNQADNSAGEAGAVYVFSRSGTRWEQQAYLKASNARAGAQFGMSVALSADGSTLVVGAPLESSSATGVDGDQADDAARWAGAVYVFTRSGTRWRQEAYVKASNTAANDMFGTSVTLSGDAATLAVGAINESSGAVGIDGDQTDRSVPSAGAVYLFTRDQATWQQQAYVKASNTGRGDSFGASVALSADGGTLVVGASTEDSAATGIDGDQTDNSATEAGAVYVFTRTGSTWGQQAYIKASNTSPIDLFGSSVAVSGDGATLAVGAYAEDSGATGVNGNQSNDAMLESGAAYIFTRNGGAWSQEAYVKASNTGLTAEFGWSLAMSSDGSKLAVAAVTEDSGAIGIDGDQHNLDAIASGAVYVFQRAGARWWQQAYIKASNTDSADQFGSSVSMASDGSIAVGALGEASAATGAGGDQNDNSEIAAGAVYVVK